MPALLRFDIFTLLPEVFASYLETSILQRARQNNLLEVYLHNIRNWTTDRHHITDDMPYGGGGGMVMKPEPVFAAVESILGSPPACPLILLTPQGRRFTQLIAQELAERALGNRLSPTDPDDIPHEVAAPGRLAMLCGRYEGFDERIRQHLASEEISIGDYVLTGGELAALVIIDAVTRLIPGSLGDPDGAWDDSHASGLLEYPHYTRPPEFRGWRVPDILLSGDHGRIARWRHEQSLLRTYQRRPDLLESTPLNQADRKFLQSLKPSDPQGETGPSC